MKVVLIDEGLCWPLDKGQRIRSYHLLARLARLHSIYLVAYRYEDDDPSAQMVLENLGVEVLTVDAPPMPKSGPQAGAWLLWSAMRGLPHSAALYGRLAMRDAIRDVVRRVSPDLVHVELTTMSHAVPDLNGMPMVLNAHNCETRIWQRLAARQHDPLRALVFGLQSKLMRRFERRSLARYEHVCPVSPEDHQELLKLAPEVAYTVVPNGVDLASFCDDGTDPQPHSIVFTGALDWRPMQDAVVTFVEDTFPLIRKAVPDARLTVVGRRPPTWLHGRVGSQPGVRLLSDVPDIRVPLRAAAVSIAPLRVGSGSRLKILEAMAIGRPVVSSTVGAEGLDLVNGEHIFVADEPESFKRAVLHLWDDSDTYERLRRNSRNLVEERFGWDQIAKVLHEVWMRVGSCSSRERESSRRV